MAGAGYKLFNTGDVLTAAQVNTYLQEQTVMVFADATARTTALSSVLAEGMVTYLKDTNAIEKYTGAAWVNIDSGSTSPLTTKGDLYTYSTTDARLAVGNNGETLVPDSSTSTGLRWQGNFAAGKNKIINGDFGIWQRGTSFSPVANVGIFSADRFIFQRDGSGYTATLSRQTFTPGAAPVAGYEGQYFWRYNVTTAGTSNTYAVLDQRIENVQTLAGQTATISFWAKADAARTVTLDVTQEFGSGGSSQVTTSGGSNSVTTSWTRFTATISVPSISGKTVGTGSYLIIRFNFPTGVTETIDIWGIQVEAGNTATAFQTATGTLAGELAACQRYYWRSTVGITNDAVFPTAGTAFSTTVALWTLPNPTTMRSAGSSIEVSNVGVYDSNAATNRSGGTWSLNQALNGTVNRVIYTHGSAVFTAGSSLFSSASGSNAYFAMNAEL